ncbi:TetR/AcrR family transcriptional regulator [Streptosporangium subroseum]|uniref:TetR/AcrR family transcriptional regulator n=1 Tax=Streptosporangium subroseum TaxID=106412 RepID=UPI003093A688|nr:TetR/AcrR family transcriptional regulator [Streptosporangium subroseum]
MTTPDLEKPADGFPLARKRSRGRPRAFDLDEAVDRALELFWRQGYAATTVADLTAAIGINPPSLYKAFGSKQELFERVVRRYAELNSRVVEVALACPDVESVVRQFLTGVIESATESDCPAGCLTIQGGTAGREGEQEVTDLLAALRRAIQDALEQRFEQLKAEGGLRADQSASALARYVATVGQGLAVQAGGGATREELMIVVELAARTVA